MYQTVGHQGIAMIAEAMELPLYRRTTKGDALEKGKIYNETENDEVEDLYELLKMVKVSYFCTYHLLFIIMLFIYNELHF